MHAVERSAWLEFCSIVLAAFCAWAELNIVIQALAPSAAEAGYLYTANSPRNQRMSFLVIIALPFCLLLS